MPYSAKKTSAHLDTGRLGETLAAQALIQKGHKIIARNFQHKKLEIDIISLCAHRIHFIEVKTRSSVQFGYPEESVNKKKMDHIKELAEHYLLTYPIYETYWVQFDIIAVLLTKNERQAAKEIRFFEDVF